MHEENHGVLIAPPRPSDYILGGIGEVNPTAVVKDWSVYLPELEYQSNSKTDFLNCTTFSGGHCIESQLNYLLFTKQFSDEALNFFHDNKFIDHDTGLFHISKRFNAKMNGTDKLKGQYLNVAGDGFRNDGYIPDYLWPLTEDMSWNEYYKEIPQAFKDLAQKVKWFIDIKYQWVPSQDLIAQLINSPIQIATQVCPGWDSGKVVNKCSGRVISHATMIYGVDSHFNWLNLDQYAPFKQLLAPDYELPYNMRYIVTLKPVALRKGMRGVNVLTLQENLKKLKYNIEDDSFFGPASEKIVKQFQSSHGLVADGIAGTKTLEMINKLLATPSSKIDKWCAAIKQMEGAKPERNNPGNLRYIGQQYAIDDRGFCKFDTYEHGYQALKNLLINACTGKSKIYKPSHTLYDFYEIYAPDTDGNNPDAYAEFVAKYIGVSPEITISRLII